MLPSADGGNFSEVPKFFVTYFTSLSLYLFYIYNLSQEHSRSILKKMFDRHLFGCYTSVIQIPSDYL